MPQVYYGYYCLRCNGRSLPAKIWILKCARTLGVLYRGYKFVPRVQNAVQNASGFLYCSSWILPQAYRDSVHNYYDSVYNVISGIYEILRWFYPSLMCQTLKSVKWWQFKVMRLKYSLAINVCLPFILRFFNIARNSRNKWHAKYKGFTVLDCYIKLTMLLMCSTLSVVEV